jgi:hypothetical protein
MLCVSPDPFRLVSFHRANTFRLGEETCVDYDPRVRKAITTVALLALLQAGCRSSTNSVPHGMPVQSGAATIASEASGIDPSGWKTFVSDAYGFLTLKYPADWKLVGEGKTATYGIIARLYAPKSAAVLEQCGKTRSPTNPNQQCAAAEADFAIGIYDAGYVKYASLTDQEKQAYPNYQDTSENGLDRFEFDSTGDVPVRIFHVNSPDGKTGVTIAAWSELQIAKTISSSVILNHAGR